MSLYEVELLKDVNHCLEVYRARYLKRYRTEPLMRASGSDTTLIRDLVKQHGRAKALDLLEHYLTMETRWFLEQAHSLEALKRNLLQVNTSLAMKRPKQVTHTGVMISVPWTCDGCWERCIVITPLNYNWDNETLCENCRINGKPPQERVPCPVNKRVMINKPVGRELKIGIRFLSDSVKPLEKE